MTDTRTPTLTTRVARAGFDDHRWFGRSVLHEVRGRDAYVDLIVTAVTGRTIPPADRAMLDELAVLMTAADPRIWPLKLTRLVGSYGGTLAAFAAGHLCLEGDLLGPWTTMHAAEMLSELRAAIGGEIDDPRAVEREVGALLARRKRLVGYGVPFRPIDERFVAVTEMVVREGRAERPHWRLQRALSAQVLADRKLGPNLGIGVTAMLLDLGFSRREVPAITIFLNENVFVATAVEAAADVAGGELLRELPATVVRYVGPPPRVSPRAAAATADSRGSRSG